MVRFCQFYDVHREEIVQVNPEQIAYMRPDKDYAVTHLAFGDRHILTVDGNIESTLTVIDNARRT